jgi:prevent-host-death family protein
MLYNKYMKELYQIIPAEEMTVADLKANFSDVLDRVKKGEKVKVLYGKAKKPVAMIVPIPAGKKAERKIGILDGKAKIEFKENFKMTTEELLDMK